MTLEEEKNWNSIIAYCRIRYPRCVQSLEKAKAFHDGIRELQNLAGHSQEQFSEIRQGLLDMVQEED